MLTLTVFWTIVHASPLPQNQVQQPIGVQPVPGQLMHGAMVPTSVLNQIGDTTTQIQTQTNANAMTAIRNFFGDVALVSNAISMIASGAVTDPQTIANLAQVAFNAEINENDQRMVMLAASGGQSAAQDANNNILTFTPTVLNGLQALAQNPTQNAQMIAQAMGTVRNARILPSISILATTATGGSIPVSTVIQRTTQASDANQGAVQDFNSAALLAAVNNADSGNIQGGVASQQTNQPVGTTQPVNRQQGVIQPQQPVVQLPQTDQQSNQVTTIQINGDGGIPVDQSISDQQQNIVQNLNQQPIDTTQITISTGDQSNSIILS